MIKRVQLRPQVLTPEVFRTFGTVIDTRSAKALEINQGFAQRFDDLIDLDVLMQEGSAKLSLFIAQPRPRPIAIKMMERHPLGSQTFVPMQDRDWLVLVCDNPLVAASYKCFLATGRQGVSYNRGAWHHPLLVFDADSHFTVVDRKGPGNNLEEVWLPESLQIEIAS
jgi:ureidoglycolate lyase